MSIEKKSLISTLKTTKKANVAANAPEPSRVVSKIVKAQKVMKKPKISKIVKKPRVSRA